MGEKDRRGLSSDIYTVKKGMHPKGEWSIQWLEGYRNPDINCVASWNAHGITVVPYEVSYATITVPGIDISLLETEQRKPEYAYVVSDNRAGFRIVIVDDIEKVPEKYREGDGQRTAFSKKDTVLVNIERNAEVIQPVLGFSAASDNRFNVSLEVSLKANQYQELEAELAGVEREDL